MTKFSEDLKSKLIKLIPDSKNINWAEFESIFTKKTYPKKYNWVEEHEVSDKVAFVESGLLRIFMYDKNGEEKTHSFVIEGGATLNHFSIFAGEPSPVCIQTIEETVMYETSFKKIKSFFGKLLWVDELYRNLLTQTFMYKLKREMFFVMFDAKERIDHLDHFPYVDLRRIPKIHLASFLGIKPQSLSRLYKGQKIK